MTVAHVAPTRHTVRIVVSRQQALEAMQRARDLDVERGGVYDARSAAVNIWSCAWDTSADRMASELVGTILLKWGVPHDDLATICRLEVEHGWTLTDVEWHLALLFGARGGSR